MEPKIWCTSEEEEPLIIWDAFSAYHISAAKMKLKSLKKSSVSV